MEGSWKFNEELSTALGQPIPYFEEAKYAKERQRICFKKIKSQNIQIPQK